MYVTPLQDRGYFKFWNQVTRKLTAIPTNSISENMLYMPTNSPGTGEMYITLILAVNGDYDINYDEDENRFDSNFNYRTPYQKTRVDIYLNRQCAKMKRSYDGETKQAARDSG